MNFFFFCGFGAKNVKIQENSEKNQGTSGGPVRRDPLQPFLGPYGTLKHPKFGKICLKGECVRLG